MIALHAGSDILIWLAYLSIPLILGYFALQRGIGRFNKLVWLFAAFILCCGFTHLLDAMMFERPVYHLSGVMKALTAIVSWTTVFAFIPVVPRLLSAVHRMNDTSLTMPTLAALQAAQDKPETVGQRYVVAVLAAVVVALVRGLLYPVMGSSHTFIIPLLAVVFVSWNSGFGPGIVTLLLSLVATVTLFLETESYFLITRLPDQLASGIYLFAGVGCALLGQAQRHYRSRAERNLEIAQDRQRELEDLTHQLAISQRQTAETLAQLDTFVMNAPLGMAFLDPQLRFVRVNKHLADANEKDIVEYLGKPIDEVVPDLPADAVADYRRVMETGEPLVDQLVFGPSGEHAATDRVWQSSYYPVRGPGGNLLGVGLVTREISEQIRAEKALRESEARFRTLAEAMPQIVWLSRADGHVEYFNPQWYIYTGELTDQSSRTWVDAVLPEDRAYVMARWQQALTDGTPYESEHRLRRHDQTYRWHLARGLAVQAPNGTITQWVGTITDIEVQRRYTQALEQQVRERTAELLEVVNVLRSEVDVRRRAEQNAQVATEELRRSNGELEQFAYVASHDLQEPLRKIQAFGSRLQTNYSPQLGDAGGDYLLRMLKSAGRMRQLIEDLLTFSRVTSKGQPFGPVDLRVVAEDVLSDLEIRIHQSNGTVEIAEMPTIHADPVQMGQLFQNLISNALKFHRPETPPVVRVTATLPAEENSSCVLRFADNGIGFDVKYLDRIFQVFQRLHGRGEYEGTGVGLAICRKIVERHGGTITATSSPGEGATFIVTLPVRRSTTLVLEANAKPNEADHNTDGR